MHSYRVVANEALTSSTTLITLQPENTGEPFTFVPGQYAAISFYRGTRPSAARCFSIVSSPTEPGKLQFSMRNSGRYTRAVSRLLNGARVDILGPFGGFVFDRERDQKAVFMAGGIGITPFMSMLRYMTQLDAPNEITLLYSCRNQDDVPFLDELKALRHQNPFLKIIYVISEGETTKLAGEHIVTGRITPELLDRVTASNYTDESFYICGPPPFMKGMVTTLRRKGVREARIITEAFGQGSNRQTGKLKSYPFNIYVLGAVGVVLSSLVVMALDIIKTLPSAEALGLTKSSAQLNPTNTRQGDLDKLVNELPALPSTGGPSAAVIAARLAAQPKAATPAPYVAPSAPAVYTAPAPVCRTTPSGVTTCQ